MPYLDFLQYSYFGNTLLSYLIAAGIFILFLIGAVILNFFLNRFFIKFAKKTKTKFDDTLMKIFNKVVVFVLVLAGIYFGLKSLNIPENIWIYIEKGAQIILIVKIFQAITLLVDFIIETYFSRFFKAKDGFNIQLTRLVTRIVNIALWVIGASMILNLFGYDIGALIAGLGIGGLAIALAAQDTLGNFFSSVSIIADKPYKTGDVIKFDTYEGIVKDIGLRTTRLETFSGTFVSVPNSVLAKSIVENMSKRNTRRYDGQIGLVYDTTPTQMRKALTILRDLFKKEENITQNFRVNFTEYDNSALRIEYMFLVKNPEDYNLYLRTRNKLNLAIKESFGKEGLEMAYPTQTVYLQKEEK